ncbi:MAG: hypothetical protein FWH06_02125 [Oscillospiraceae bacterium]|nr:hypothetical protein [Oscillospiraceae bacterium]
MSGVYRAPKDVGFLWGFKQLKEVKDFDGFKHWFTDVFWYHYKFPMLGVVAGLTIIIYMIVSMVSNVRPDVTVLYATQSGLYEEAAAGLSAELSGAVTGPDGEPLIVDVTPVNLGGEGEYAYISRMKMMAILSQQDVLLVILDKQDIDLMLEDEPDTFMPLDELGMDLPDPGLSRFFVDTRHCPKLDAFGRPHGQDMRAGIVRRMSATPEQYETACDVLRYLMT